MKTTRAKSFLHLLVTLTMLAGLLTSCGKENESGGGSSNNYGTIAGGGNGGVPSNWFSILQNEYPCVNAQYNGGSNKNTRVKSTINIQNAVNVNAGGFHVGVTMEGDLAILTKKNNATVLEVYACQRPSINLSQQPQINQTPIINVSRTCAVDEISALNVYLNSNYGTYLLAFFPIGLHAPSSLCQNGNTNPGLY